MDEWDNPLLTKVLKGNGDGLIEVKIKTNVEWRVFGFGGPKGRSFTVTGIGSHKMQIYYPKEVIPKSNRIRQELESGKAKAVICDRPKQR